MVEVEQDVESMKSNLVIMSQAQRALSDVIKVPQISSGRRVIPGSAEQRTILYDFKTVPGTEMFPTSKHI